VIGVVRGTGRLPGRLAHWLLDPLARRPVRALRWLVAGVVAGLVLAAAAVAGAYLTLPGHIRLAWPATVMTWRTLAAAGISLALAAVAGVAIGSVRRDWRWPWPRGGERPGLVREVLLVAVTASTAWVAWQRPLPWQYGLVIAITAGLAGWRLRWPRQRAAAPLGQISGPPARYLARRIGVLRQIRDRWHQLPAGAPAGPAASAPTCPAACRCRAPPRPPRARPLVMAAVPAVRCRAGRQSRGIH